MTPIKITELHYDRVMLTFAFIMPLQNIKKGQLCTQLSHFGNSSVYCHVNRIMKQLDVEVSTPAND